MGMPIYIISACEKLTVCDVTNLPHLDINWQSIFIQYGYFVTSPTAYYSCADIRSYNFFSLYMSTCSNIHFPHSNLGYKTYCNTGGIGDGFSTHGLISPTEHVFHTYEVIIPEVMGGNTRYSYLLTFPNFSKL